MVGSSAENFTIFLVEFEFELGDKVTHYTAYSDVVHTAEKKRIIAEHFYDSK